MSVSANYFSEDYFSGKVKSNYDNYNLLDNDGYWRDIVGVVRKYRLTGNVLDVGCAFGFLLARLEPIFKGVYGVDISDYALRQARKVVPSAKLKKLDLGKDLMPYKDGFFDLITALDVLEHTDSISDAVSKLARKIRPGGYMIISLPVRDTWVRKIFGFVDRDKSHVGIPSMGELDGAVASAGLRVAERRPFMPLTYFKIYGIPADILLVCRKKGKTRAARYM